MNEQTPLRLKALHQRMTETGTGLVAIAPGSHMEWLLGFHPHPDERPCLLLIGPENEAFLMPALNAEGCRQFSDIAFHNWADDEGPDGALASALSTINAKKPGLIALDETMRADFALLLLDALPVNTRRGFMPATLGYLRMRKDIAEYAKLKMNAEIADRVMQSAFTAIRPGMTEKELAAHICTCFVSEGAEPQFAIVGAGSNGAFPHHSASDCVMEEGDPVVIDIGGRVYGYPSDITRMVVIGAPPDGYDEIHMIVEKAVQAALETARPGIRASEVDAAARRVISDAGYGGYFVHRTGHGMGIDGHEPPYITATSETILEEGMIFSIEPGIYLPGRFGIRLEDIVILRDTGPEILSALPRDVHVARV